MPEGDILRRTATRLDEALAGQVLERAELRWPTAAGVDLVGRTVLGTRPYGKHLLTRFDDGRTLHTHLRMDGEWRIARTGTPAARGRSEEVRALLATSRWTAYGRLLGMLDVLPTRDEPRLLGHLGPDVLADELDLDEVLERWRAAGQTPAAEVLLDQRVAAGIGTIYCAESLFALRLWPWTPADEVPDPVRLYRTARQQMQRSVLTGFPPGRVHGRLRQPCPRCGTPVAVGQARRPPMQRPVFYCPTCQRAR
ncbi:DNA-formamidopyrimidine glycosylase family protein [Cellulomonas persica]|uniref:DNA-(apurinic or apyrimidinic site) lyase n=1 Tax=Cellulomonas persica TaxID=76861 RepID=A0A510UW08_9CELL|nr:DNA-formamidopyrimidine glycosylase family protein [Cellulomonas persica]GEK18828.1 putative endonuclease 8 2 [Cellulomonas persica]